MVNELKNQFKNLIKDERGISESAEKILWILGGVGVTSIVIGVVTVLITGENKDGNGGIAGTVKESINTVIEDLTVGN